MINGIITPQTRKPYARTIIDKAGETFGCSRWPSGTVSGTVRVFRRSRHSGLQNGKETLSRPNPNAMLQINAKCGFPQFIQSISKDRKRGLQTIVRRNLAYEPYGAGLYQVIRIIVLQKVLSAYMPLGVKDR